ncbi:tripartite tricarboxylate transporter permease [Tropicimonas sp. IMCC6043]|uniref:tripartite tricarboxylate transporter permease n=1 Tax=Tropicimonas sp. IMCC6043 TaxID=2510645 RepID=UPI00101BA444|nr:tripartite tricarboxylate transporter permease [Tropicimonas sp. IMCC6043]RYH12248.1 C4-dicarboxylate ABC transporter permease [Tropicimonas sp. IMCC6043]
MLDLFLPILHALPVVLEWPNILGMVVGVLTGMIVGSLPGLTATLAIAVLIPLTFSLQPLVALGLMAGIYNGAMYGGAIPAILLNIPGTPPSIVTTFDGYPMAQEGRAGYALKIACWSSAIGGAFSAVSLMLFAPPLVKVTLLFGPAEYFWVAIFGMSTIAILLGKDPVKGIIAGCIGLILGSVGSDVMTGHQRLTWDQKYLIDGINLLIILTGLYAIPPAIRMIEKGVVRGYQLSDFKSRPEDSLSRNFWSFVPTWLRSSAIGIWVGILPATGGSMAAFIAYNETKRVSKEPESFGKGNPLGIAAAECGNNADNAAAMIPALVLGVPGSGVSAVILAGLLVHGLQPGPQLFRDTPDIVFGFMWQMLLTSLLLFTLGGNVATRVFAQVMRLPQPVLAPMILCLTFVGIYALSSSMFNVWLMFGLGIFGYLLNRLHFPLAPIVLGLILGDMAEHNLRLTLLINQGDWWSLLHNPLSMLLAGLSLLIMSLPLIGMLRRKLAGTAETPAAH